MSKDSTKLQSHRKEIFARWLSSTFFVSDAQSISDSFVLWLFNYTLLRGEKLNYKFVAKEISKPPLFDSWSPVGTESLPCLFDSRFL